MGNNEIEETAEEVLSLWLELLIRSPRESRSESEAVEGIRRTAAIIMED